MINQKFLIRAGVAAVLLALAPLSFSAPPPNVVTSDGDGNTAMGSTALQENTTGFSNTASGSQALASNTIGHDNTAMGTASLIANTVGNGNTAVGVCALCASIFSSGNTAVGAYSLATDFEGYGNSALGDNALALNTAGYFNVAAGVSALYANTEGHQNIGIGTWSLSGIQSANDNTAIGHATLRFLTSGTNNIAIGSGAGGSLTAGDNNIEIGTAGVAADSGVIRIGTPGTQRKAFVQGIWANPVRRGAEVVVGANGELGVEVSSERFKSDIEPMQTDSAKIRQLRPVSYHLNSDAPNERRFGLIAEEVNDVYPELVVKDDDGQIEGVRYSELTPILLNELQNQERRIESQDAKIQQLSNALEALQNR